MNNRLHRAQEIKEFLNRIKHFKQLLGEITIDDMELLSRRSQDGRTFSIVFPDNLALEFSAIVSAIDKLEKGSSLYELYHYIFYGTASNMHGGLDANIQILDKDNILHITRSRIAPGFRGLRLGIKFYKGFFEKLVILHPMNVIYLMNVIMRLKVTLFGKA